MTRSWDAATFDRLYATNPDPWDFHGSDYERAKYDATLAALPARCGDLLEVGCSIGVLTNRLAPRCDQLLALDFAEAALIQARLACAAHPHVRFLQAGVPAGWPDGRFDVILFSEVLYFLSPADIDTVAQRATAALQPGGTILLVNWTGPNDAPCTGDRAAELFISECALDHELVARESSYRIDKVSKEAVLF